MTGAGTGRGCVDGWRDSIPGGPSVGVAAGVAGGGAFRIPGTAGLGCGRRRGVGAAGSGGGGTVVGEFLPEVVGEVDEPVREEVVGDVDEGVDPAGTDASVVAGGAGGAGGQQVGDLEDLHRPVGGQVRLQRGHPVGLGVQLQFPAGGRILVPVLGAVRVDDDHR